MTFRERVQSEVCSLLRYVKLSAVTTRGGAAWSSESAEPADGVGAGERVEGAGSRLLLRCNMEVYTSQFCLTRKLA